MAKCMSICGFGFYGRFLLCSLEMWHHHFAAPKSACPPSENPEDQIVDPSLMEGLSSARSSFNMYLSPWVGYQVGKPSLISHLEQEEELRMEERDIQWGTSPGE